MYNLAFRCPLDKGLNHTLTMTLYFNSCTCINSEQGILVYLSATETSPEDGEAKHRAQGMTKLRTSEYFGEFATVVLNIVAMLLLPP